MEGANSIAATTDASNNNIWELSTDFPELLLDLLANDFLEVSDNSREGMGTDSGANEIVCGREVSYPIAKGFVDSIFQRTRTRMDRNNL